MSLLNRPSDGFHSNLVVIYKLLLLEKKLSREKIKSLCSPPTAIDSNYLGDTIKSLNRWTQLGLFVESDGEVSINPIVPKKDLRIERLPSVARGFVLKSENNDKLFDKEGSLSADFTRMQAWSLTQDVWEYDQTSDVEVNLRLNKQTKDNSIFQQNDTRWSGFKAWSQFLGFAWTPPFPKAKIEPDPTEAIRDVLHDAFNEEDTLDALSLIKRLSEYLPVLDGGRYRRMVEDLLGESEGEYSWRPLPVGQLSTSLSRALIRLREDGTLHFEDRDDSEHRLSLTGRGRIVLATVTHISFKGGIS
ncbi:MAG: protein DpdG [Verrucomicrobiaceae bacterium]